MKKKRVPTAVREMGQVPAAQAQAQIVRARKMIVRCRCMDLAELGDCSVWSVLVDLAWSKLKPLAVKCGSNLIRRIVLFLLSFLVLQL